MRDSFMEQALEKWGAWRIGARGASIAPWARMRNGMPMSNGETDHLPPLHLAELALHDLILNLPKKWMRFCLLAYPDAPDVPARLERTRGSVNESKLELHRKLRRLQDQWRRGEAFDVARPRPRAKVQRITVQDGNRRVRLAAVAVDE